MRALCLRVRQSGLKLLGGCLLNAAIIVEKVPVKSMDVIRPRDVVLKVHSKRKTRAGTREV